MEPVVRVCDSFKAADRADLDEWLALPGDERIRIGEARRGEAFRGRAQRRARVLRVVGLEHAS